MSRNNRLAGMARCRLPLVLLAVLVCAGCASAPPVQEMSDARQAIAAAREAGAAELAADRLQAAEKSLAEAESQLQGGVYRAARRAALAAKGSAVDALLLSRSRREQQGSPGSQ